MARNTRHNQRRNEKKYTNNPKEEEKQLDIVKYFGSRKEKTGS